MGMKTIVDAIWIDSPVASVGFSKLSSDKTDKRCYIKLLYWYTVADMRKQFASVVPFFHAYIFWIFTRLVYDVGIHIVDSNSKSETSINAWWRCHFVVAVKLWCICMCVYYSGIEIEPYLLPLASCFSIETVMKRKMWTIDCFMEIGGLPVICL